MSNTHIFAASRNSDGKIIKITVVPINNGKWLASSEGIRTTHISDLSPTNAALGMAYIIKCHNVVEMATVPTEPAGPTKQEEFRSLLAKFAAAVNDKTVHVSELRYAQTMCVEFVDGLIEEIETLKQKI
jgi:hypothetical protein